MIVRMWRGRAKPGMEGDYVAHLQTAVLPEIKALPGSLGAQVLRGVDEASREFFVLTYWTHLDAVTSFAGLDRDTAVVPEEARKVLADYDPFVRHFNVVVDTTDDAR